MDKASQSPQKPRKIAKKTAIERNLKYPSVLNLRLKSLKNCKYIPRKTGGVLMPSIVLTSAVLMTDTSIIGIPF